MKIFVQVTNLRKSVRIVVRLHETEQGDITYTRKTSQDVIIALFAT
jgi:hypothetical protein